MCVCLEEGGNDDGGVGPNERERKRKERTRKESVRGFLILLSSQVKSSREQGRAVPGGLDLLHVHGGGGGSVRRRNSREPIVSPTSAPLDSCVCVYL